MKVSPKTNPPSVRRRMRVRRFVVSLSLVVGVAVMGTAFASARARVANKSAASREAGRSLPQEWVWQKEVVVLDDMFRE